MMPQRTRVLMATPDDIQLSADFPVPPQVIYDAWLEGSQHAAMTGAPASGHARVDAPFSAWDGYIWGTNLELVCPHFIVQSWTTSDFPEGSPPSRLEIALEPGPHGTQLRLTHSQHSLRPERQLSTGLGRLLFQTHARLFQRLTASLVLPFHFFAKLLPPGLELVVKVNRAHGQFTQLLRIGC